ncbi:MAG: HAD-IC family P-type ATPase, partial [Rickettsiaceae bacterium]|nr:HAD-IC family P-type ATPase [Rickettsiaceae bacterium]
MKKRKKAKFHNIFFNALLKMRPGHFIHNPMLFIIFIFACAATLLLIREIQFATVNVALYFQMTFWIWMTLYFSTFADSYAESKMHYIDEDYNNQDKSVTYIKKIPSLKSMDDIREVEYNEVKSGNLILLKSGDIVPFDGKIIHGRCYVNETDITGELESKFKDCNNGDILTAGSIIQGSDSVILKVSFAKNISFFAKAAKQIKGINRESLPSEVALQRLILGLSILFMSVIFTVWVIAKYSGFDIPAIYLIDLAVILLPTTISGLQHAIIIFGKAKLLKYGIIVHDLVSLDNVVDVNVIILDKTGTLTIGQRQMTNFTLLTELSEDEGLEYLFLSSIEDKTIEGKSVKEYALKKLAVKPEVAEEKYKYLPFSASKPISGCDYKGMQIRKGSVREVCKHIGKKEKNLPASVKELIVSIAKSHGTALLLTVNKKIIGVIHLRDRFRKGVQKQVDRLCRQGIKVIMVTGDNEQTASYVAQKLGIDSFYFDATPDKKLELVQSLQEEGYIVAMCGDGINDSLALAQSDIGFTFESVKDLHPIMAGNIISKTHNLSALLELKDTCKKMTVKRGALTVFSLASDITKYFVIVPALFITAFPPLAILNFMNFHSLESVVLSSVMFNSLVIFVLIPILFKGFNKAKSKYSLWLEIALYGIGGLVSPFICIFK